jgi:hypothetical protein
VLGKLAGKLKTAELNRAKHAVADESLQLAIQQVLLLTKPLCY